MKSGLKTTEFWLTVVSQILGLVGILPLPTWAYPVITGIYTISRGLAKAGIIRGTGGEVLKRLPEQIP